MLLKNTLKQLNLKMVAMKDRYAKLDKNRVCLNCGDKLEPENDCYPCSWGLR